MSRERAFRSRLPGASHIWWWTREGVSEVSSLDMEIVALIPLILPALRRLAAALQSPMPRMRGWVVARTRRGRVVLALRILLRIA